ncbi:MAG: type II CAAX prenyl endopeptidase Rce1 family protein [Gammaproteobacteria bacterium]
MKINSYFFNVNCSQELADKEQKILKESKFVSSSYALMLIAFFLILCSATLPYFYLGVCAGTLDYVTARNLFYFKKNKITPGDIKYDNFMQANYFLSIIVFPIKEEAYFRLIPMAFLQTYFDNQVIDDSLMVSSCDMSIYNFPTPNFFNKNTNFIEMNAQTLIVILISAIIFGWAHSKNKHQAAYIQAKSAVLSGLLYGLMLANYGIYSCFATHITNNLISFAFMYSEKNLKNVIDENINASNDNKVQGMPI